MSLGLGFTAISALQSFHFVVFLGGFCVVFFVLFFLFCFFIIIIIIIIIVVVAVSSSRNERIFPPIRKQENARM